MKRKRTDANGFYLTRRDQIEGECVPECLAAKTPRAMRKALRNAALIAACGERDRTLEILREHGLHSIAEEICKVPVLEVLEYKP